MMVWSSGGEEERPLHVLYRWDMRTVVTQSDLDEGAEMVRLARACWPRHTLCVVIEGLAQQVRTLHAEKSLAVPLHSRLLNLREVIDEFAIALELGLYDDDEDSSNSSSSNNVLNTQGGERGGGHNGGGEEERPHVGNAVSVVHSECEATTAALVLNFTQCVSRAAAKTRLAFRHAHLPFFTGTVRERTDGTLADTWVAVLARVPEVPRSKAAAIAARFPTLHSLLAAYSACATPADRERLLLAVPGVGSVVARRVAMCFCGSPNDTVS